MLKTIVILVFTLSLSGLFSQEILHPLQNNVKLFKNNSIAGNREIGLSRDTLCLPFFDDFSNLSAFLDSVNTTCFDTIFNNSPSLIYPNQLFWLDSSAYINRTLPILPPTYGAATLDGLGKNGLPYNEAIDFGKADVLTSKPIDLDGILLDTVYLSFYYQPGGFGDFPEEDDSLLVEFLNNDSVWIKVWQTTNQNGPVNQPFSIAMIAIAEPQFLYNAFQFRFRNWASINGNNDHWNIDYVLLDEDRSFNDTIFRDVSFVENPSSFLKTYRQMPWKQFKNFQTEELNSTHSIQIKNNYNFIVNTGYQYSAFEKYSGNLIVAPTIPISINFDPNSTTFNSYSTFTIPESTPGFTEDSMVVEFKYVVDPSGDDFRINDTLFYELPFYNYYAFDDGSAEKAYKLVGTGAQLAMHFKTNEPDTVKQVYIHWANVDGLHGALFFSLLVWQNIDTTLASSDEAILYQADFLTPTYVDSINGFYVYTLTDFLGNPTPVAVDGDFYIGYLQTQSDFLYVGFDMNNNASNQTYYTVGGNWQKSILTGSCMIRPRMSGDYSKYLPLEETTTAHTFEVYPNPAQQTIQWMNHLFGLMEISIYDYTGRLVIKTEQSQPQLAIEQLPAGLYTMHIKEPKSSVFYTAKFIKS